MCRTLILGPKNIDVHPTRDRRVDSLARSQSCHQHFFHDFCSIRFSFQYRHEVRAHILTTSLLTDVVVVTSTYSKLAALLEVPWSNRYYT